MLLKDIVDEDFTNYYLPSMFLSTCYCTFKCCIEANIPITVCQNESIIKQPNIEVSANEIFRRYRSNPITHALVFGGLEPMLQFNELVEIIRYFRDNNCEDDIVIYTGYNKFELPVQIETLKYYSNILIKYGRYVPNHNPHYDKMLGVNLISRNQYAEKIS